MKKHKIQSGVVVEPVEIAEKVVPELPVEPVVVPVEVIAKAIEEPVEVAMAVPVAVVPVPEVACEHTQSGQAILPENVVKPSWIA